MNTTELQQLEQQIAALIQRCENLYQENLVLKEKNQNLEQKTTIARKRIEAMISRIKKIENQSS